MRGGIKKSVIKWFFIGGMLLCSDYLFGQQRSIRFQHLTIEDGLPQNMVDCMLQDSHGFIWIGTWNGLSRYDGYTVEVFSKERIRLGSLRNNFIYDLYEDTFGNIWVATAEGLYVYLYDKGQFLKPGELEVYPEFGQVISVISPAEDSSMWVSTSGGMVNLRIQNSAGDVKILERFSFGSGKRHLRGTTVNSILQDSKDNVWVGTNEGMNVIRFDGTVTHMIHNVSDENSISSNQVLEIYESPTGIIWIGTEFGLNSYNPVSAKFTRYFNDPSTPNSLIHNTVMDLVEDHLGNLYVATLGGLSVLEAGSQSFNNYKNDTRSEYTLNNDFINCLLRDDRQNIWIGTERGGVNYYNINQNTFEHFESEIGNTNSLSHSTVNYIYEDDENIWIGTAGGGLNRYIKKKRKFIYYKHDPDDPNSISSNFVTSIFRDSKGWLWIGTWGSGLNVLQKKGATEASFVRYETINSGLISNFVSSIAEDEHGGIWVGTLGGLSRLEKDSNLFIDAVSQSANQKQIRAVGCLAFDSKENLWVGTRTGLYLFKNLDRDGPATHYSRSEFIHDPADKSSISGNYIISVLEDSQGNMWFGTYGNGINKLMEKDGSYSFEHLTTANGISNDVVFGMVEDDLGHLWLSTDYGLSRINLRDGHIRNFYSSDGLLNNQYYWSAAFKNKEGKLYFGGMNGMDTFYPHWINEKVTNPEVILTDIKLLNESVVPGEEYNDVKVLDRSIASTDSIYLSYKEKMFAIEFSSLNYHEPGMIRYAYFLEGFDEAWNNVASNRRYASYTNLKPGNYTFKVKASASNGEFAAEPTILKVIIAPPFWDTVWFRVLSVIALIGMLFGYIRFRTYNLKRQKLILEEQVRERTEQINKQKEALSYQAIQLQASNKELEQKKELIEGQNEKLEVQNKEILNQRDELIDLNQKLKLVSQLRLSFFTNISHEFRTPLTLIIGPLEKLLKEQSFNQDVQNTLNIINRNAQRLLHLINQIMDFRKIEKGRMELKVTRGNIEEFCSNVFTAFQPLSEIKEIQFTYSATNIPEEVWFDAQKMENILYNLLSNAFKYTPAKGTIRLEVSGISHDESKLNPEDTEIDEDRNVISIKVIDSGIGISEENIPLVFKRFYRIHSEEAFNIGGSGIGLALAKELIRTHHGEIFVESALREGSVFEVQFPCLRGSYGIDELTDGKSDGLSIHKQVEILKTELFDYSEESDEAIDQGFETDRKTVLVVEDNQDLRKFMALRLKTNFNILEAGDGEAGVKLAEKFNPDLIISDVMMPKMDGLELCASIKNNLSTSHIPVILLTAKSSIEDQIEGLEIGADDYLPKPFNFELLEARVQNLVESREKLRGQFSKSPNFVPQQVTVNTRDQKFLEHAIKTVESNLQDSSFGVKEFVKHMGISRSLLHKKLTALTDQSAADFINQLRLKKAMNLLQQNELNISEVAYAVGYNDPKYFSRLFSKQFGQSPKDFMSNSTVVG